MDWKPYDPAWLAEWVRTSRPDLPWLPDALACCTRAAEDGRAYLCFVDPADANQPGAEWQIAENVMLEHPREGTLVLDVLEGRRIGGIEFLRRL
ncbi:MAG TPA: hypothetical protein VGC13_31990 [Longimicrobium sp.]|jgi:hypothetical protein|uniref:hypothetical protein n=1 Tax=Longimicrobium sp. TaxID=2029185 RepID=UPI002ED7AD2F